MDLRAYYKRIREVEDSIPTEFVVVVGLDTPDGGKAGTRAEVAKPVAAKLIAEGRSRLASAEETEEYQELQAESRRAAEAFAASQRMQVTIVPSTEIRHRPTKSSRE